MATLAGGTVSRFEGVALLAGCVAAVALVWRTERGVPAFGELADDGEADDGEPDDKEPGDGKDDAPAGGPLLVVAAGLAAMTGGGVLAVLGAERLVGGLGVADSGIGLTVLALATSAELLALVVAAGRRGIPEVAVAGVLGSVLSTRR